MKTAVDWNETVAWIGGTVALIAPLLLCAWLFQTGHDLALRSKINRQRAALDQRHQRLRTQIAQCEAGRCPPGAMIDLAAMRREQRFIEAQLARGAASDTSAADTGRALPGAESTPRR